MSERRVHLDGGSLTLGEDWIDITSELNDPNAPTSLVRLPDEPGVLQISIARYESGAFPNMRAADLRGFLNALVQAQTGGEPSNVAVQEDGLVIVQGDFESAGTQHRAWYVTDGGNVALFTYIVCEPKAWGAEEPRCERIVRSFQFQ